MKTLKVEELTNETFREYGSFSDMLHPTGTFLGGIPARFFRDRVVATCEVLMPMDGDLYLAVGPARKAPDYGEFHAFRIPKGTLVCLRPGTFHSGPYTAGDEIVHTLLALPEMMYMKDCHFYPIDEPIEIVK